MKSLFTDGCVEDEFAGVAEFFEFLVGFDTFTFRSDFWYNKF
jgi:hypothetical protein